MKLILLTLFLFYVSFSNSLSIKFNEDSYFRNINNNKCDIKGFTANYQSISVNIDMSYVSYFIPFSYYENGIMVVDYETNSTLFLYHDFVDGTQIFGKCYDFFSNSTQYVVTNMTGSLECYITTPQINQLQKVSESVKIESSKVGSMNADIYQNNQPLFNFTNQVTVVDSSDCSLISVILENNYLYQGKSVYNFYNYKPEFDKSLFQLPSICYEKPKSMNHGFAIPRSKK